MPVSALSTPARVSLGCLAVLLIAAFLYLLIDGDDDPTVGADPQLLTSAELAEFARSSEDIVYWAGPQGETKLEVTTEADGSTFVRYLTPGVEAGDPASDFLTVATYPVEDAEANLEAAKDRPGAIVYAAPDGERAVSNRDNPTSVYVAPSPGTQVEIYDPSPERASDVARSGALQPAG